MKIIFCKECGAKVILTSEYQIRGRMDKCKPCQIKWLADRAIVVIEETGAPVDPGACPDLSISSIEDLAAWFKQKVAWDTHRIMMENHPPPKLAEHVTLEQAQAALDRELEKAKQAPPLGEVYDLNEPIPMRLGPLRKHWKGPEPKGDCEHCGGQCDGPECGLHAAGCIYGGPAEGEEYWMIVDGCELYHGE